MQTLLGLVLALAVGILRVGRIGFSERTTGLRGLAIDFDRADKYKPLHPCDRSLAG